MKIVVLPCASTNVVQLDWDEKFPEFDTWYEQ